MSLADDGIRPEREDIELVASASKGDDRAFRQLLERHRARILGICLRMLKNKTEADEAAQDSFVKLYFHLKDFDVSRSFSIWVASIAVNECRDRLRKRSRYSRTFRELSEVDGLHDPAQYAEVDETKARLEATEKALDELPEKLKEAIVLKAYAEYSYEEIARILKVRVGTVMSRLFRARQKLTEILDKGTSID